MSPKRRKDLVGAPIVAAVAVAALLAMSAVPALAQPASWTVVPTPSVTSGYDVMLFGVSCTSTSFCVAVGRYIANSDNTPQTVIETWDGSKWSLTLGVDASPSEPNGLSGVSCTSTSFCVAVGAFSTGPLANPTYQTLIETWNGITWSVTTSPDVSQADREGLSSISCASSSRCVAVGSYDNSAGTAQTLIETWNGSTWSITQSPDPSTSQNAVLIGVSCASISGCTAVGWYYNSAGISQTLIETWNGSTWSIKQSPDTSASQLNALYTVSCSSSNSCVAAGDYESGGSQTLIESYDGVSWSITTSPNSSSGIDSGLSGVTCASSSSCVAVGGANSDALVLTGSSAPTTPFSVTTTSLPQAVANESYSAKLATTGGVSPYTWSLSGGSFPPGLSLSASGAISGIAAKPGTYSFVVSVTDSSSPPQSTKGTVSITVADAPVLSAKGYWEVASDGGLFAFGDAHFYGSMGAKPLNKPIVGIATTPDGKGYWEVASDGGLFAFGDAHFYGSMGAKLLNKPIVGIATTPDGKGYWEVASDGGLFAFGDAHFYGSMGAKPLNKPIVGIATTPDGKGYWEVASDGGLFAFGDAHFYGSMGAKPLNKPIVGIAVHVVAG